MSRTIRTLLGVTATAGIVALGVPALSTAANASTTSAAGVTSAAPAGFLFDYIFNGHLKVAGGNFTVGRRVFLVVKYNTGRTAFSKWETARSHSITPGGTIYVETTIAAPCAGGKNGYARAYDDATKTWSPRLPVAICQRID
ncbi:hypothetical protein OHA77_35290 [Streptosporangium sp. NBC_01639]|uniref:hypothetical protein n=1 Tax=unclassified Streptosporangium TaxID=2632669 RepID=UPI002DD9C833|nr:hypothetical protein [Streptosporangium sp. NBC_01756]WSC87471.1 hypothetical protein OIE48_04465 [Streptosporangium sp. NBC_01756]WTD53847.1 hypothetical protein OHA77_35290 [Streptosporangium sp. NBC_01639]